MRLLLGSGCLSSGVVLGSILTYKWLLLDDSRAVLKYLLSSRHRKFLIVIASNSVLVSL